MQSGGKVKLSCCQGYETEDWCTRGESFDFILWSGQDLNWIYVLDHLQASSKGIISLKRLVLKILCTLSLQLFSLITNHLPMIFSVNHLIVWKKVQHSFPGSLFVCLTNNPKLQKNSVKHSWDQDIFHNHSSKYSPIITTCQAEKCKSLCYAVSDVSTFACVSFSSSCPRVFLLFSACGFVI